MEKRPQNRMNRHQLIKRNIKMHRRRRANLMRARPENVKETKQKGEQRRAG